MIICGSLVYRASIERTQWRPDLIGNRADRPQAIDMNRLKLLIKASGTEGVNVSGVSK
jgi:hypothetical protein